MIMMFGKNFEFLSVTPMDRIAGAQAHFGKGMTSGKIITVSAIIILLVVIIVVGIIRHRK